MHLDRALGADVVPVADHAVACIAGWPAVRLVEDVRGLGPAVARMLGIVEELGGPPGGRAREAPGPLRPRGVEDRRDRHLRLCPVQEAQGAGPGVRFAEGGPRTVDGEAGSQGAHAIAEALVDEALRRPQPRERLAALPHVVKLAAHELAQDAAPAVRGVDADHRHAGHRQLAAGDGDGESEGAGGGDDPFAVVGRERAIQLHDRLEERLILGPRRPPERKHDGPHEVGERAVVRTDLGAHPPIIARGAGAIMRRAQHAPMTRPSHRCSRSATRTSPATGRPSPRWRSSR